VTFHVKQSPPPALSFLEQSIVELEARGELRSRSPATGNPALSFCSNDYLGLSSLAAPLASSGAGASRLVCGDRDVHVAVEQHAAAFVDQPQALAFSSGYAANVGLLSALLDRHSFVVIDALCHASIIDGVRLSRAHLSVAPHCDASAVAERLEHADGRRAFVVTESYFSMDADSPDLTALRTICDSSGAALLVDEAHALGVLGPEGRGLCVQHGIRADAVVGTFGKAFGAGGAFVAGCPTLISWLWNRARSFVFSTGLSPVLAEAALAGMRRAAAEPWRRQRVLAASGDLRAGLAKLGLRTPGDGPIVPWLVGPNSEAVRIAEALSDLGFLVRAIRPPSVPSGTARLRLTVTAAHDSSDVERLVDAVASVLPR
jgi:8-amino-7-oxononanoate synthase